MPTDLKIKNKLKKKRKEPIIVEAVKTAVVFKMSREEEKHVEFSGGSTWASGGSLPYKHDLSSVEMASCFTESTPTIPWKSSQ